MRKSELTRKQILDQAIRNASISSLNDITIGGLAASINMSKSGLYAHFNSKENLQIAILDHTAEQFVKIVLEPLETFQDPFERLKALPDYWLGWYEGIANNCIYISAAFEYDDQTGPVHDRIKYHLECWLNYLIKLITELVENKTLLSNTDPEQFIYELYSIYLGSQLCHWLAREDDQRSRFRKSFEQLIARHLPQH